MKQFKNIIYRFDPLDDPRVNLGWNTSYFQEVMDDSRIGLNVDGCLKLVANNNMIYDENSNKELKLIYRYTPRGT